MNTTKALELLRTEMDKQGLHHVPCRMNGRLTRVFGRYRYTRSTSFKMIELSTQLVAINDESRVMDTILHEIAHALTEGHGHNVVWRAKFVELGGTGRKYYSSTDTNTITRPRSSKLYALKCEKCGYQGGRYRKRMNGYAHTGCGGKLTNIEL